jgi:hypothetical protein
VEFWLTIHVLDDEEMYEDGYGDEMEYEEEPEDDEDNISEEDEDIEGIGPIEGLSGDHNLEVEVVMDDDDDDDDDGEGSDSDVGSEDDDARVEIIDEAGNIQEIGAEEGMEDWEDEDGEDDDDEDDDDGEEEDYEGQAQDADEEQIHDLEGMIGGGPLGELVRALGGGNPSAMEDMVERMQEEEQEELERAEIEDEEAEERMQAEYDMEDEEDDDEGEDMDDEDMFLGQGYPGDGEYLPLLRWRWREVLTSVGGPVAFGWEGEVDPPVIHRHRHAPRHAFPNPFPFFPGGRDPLGGRSNAFITSRREIIHDAEETIENMARARDQFEIDHLSPEEREALRRDGHAAARDRRDAQPQPLDPPTRIGNASPLVRQLIADRAARLAQEIALIHAAVRARIAQPSLRGIDNPAMVGRTMAQGSISIDHAARRPQIRSNNSTISDAQSPFSDSTVIVERSANSPTVPETFRYRSHRPGGGPTQGTRQIDDGQNPLLVRGGPRRPEVQRASLGSWISTMGPPGSTEVSFPLYNVPSDLKVWDAPHSGSVLGVSQLDENYIYPEICPYTDCKLPIATGLDTWGWAIR